MEPLKKIQRTPNALALLLAALVALFGVIYQSNKNLQIAMLPIEYTLTAEAKLTALAPTSTNVPTPTLIPTSKPPFDVFVTIEGGPQQKNPSFPLKFPPLKQITIEVPIADRSIDHCNWSIEWQEGIPTPEPQGCSLTFRSLTFGKVIVNVSIFTSDGETLPQSLVFEPQ